MFQTKNKKKICLDKTLNETHICFLGCFVKGQVSLNSK